MKTPTLYKLRDKMEKTLEPKRYEHTLSVAYTAANLAAVHGADVEKALLAGMLHDCAKCMSHKKQAALCGKYHMKLSPMWKPQRIRRCCMPRPAALWRGRRMASQTRIS